MKYIYLSLIVLVTSLLTACGNSWIDGASPSTSIESGESMTIPEEAEYALNGIYYTLREYEYYGARYTYYADVKGDDMQANGDTKRSQRYYFFNHSKENSPESFWFHPYKVIRSTNSIMEYINQFSESEMTDQLRNIKGEALALRALAHFDLVKVYGLPYTKNNGNSPGVPIQITKASSDSKPSRNTVAEVYEQIIKDLEAAEPLITKSANKGKLNWYGSQLLLSRVYLYMGNNQKAYEIATDVIGKAESNGYRLWTTAEYPNVWAGSFTSEIFFQIVIVAEEDGPGNEGMGYLLYRSGYDDIAVTSDFIDLIGEDPDDVRHSVYSEYYRSSDKKTIYYLLKYPGNDGEIRNYADIPVLRLSEAYLIAAEAAVKLGDNTNALAYLNPIVSRANPEKEVTGTVTLERVLTERRKEFIGEGHRFYDAMRNNQRIERTGESHLSALSAEARSFDWDWYRIVLPIPVAETNANPNVEQNPGF